jgi:hypothetical protein
MGIVTQKSINRKIFKRNRRNGGYYLEGEGSLREKLRKVFEFKEVKEMIKSGKKELLQLKNMITEDQSDEKKRGDEDLES